MNRFRLISLALIAIGMGCQSHPDPVLPAAELRIVAVPRVGAKQSLARVAVYDAAPEPTSSKNFERVDYSRLSDIVVWLEPASPERSALLETCWLDIDPGKPSTSVCAASVGQQIAFKNTSQRPIALYSVSDGNEFQLAPMAPGAVGQFVFRGEGPVEILYDPGKPPVAQLYVAPSAWVARAQAGTTVTFQNIPPGHYEARCWHPRLPGNSVPMTLASGQVTHAVLGVGVNLMSVSNHESSR